MRFLSFLLCFCLIFEQAGWAQVAGSLDISGRLSGSFGFASPDKFRPLHLRSLSLDPAGDDIRLLLDKGDAKDPGESDLEAATKKLWEYFLIGVTLPNGSFWVNLRPDSPDNIIDRDLAKTDMGRVFLEADVQLKKDAARLTSPETAEGREYWDKLYRKAEELFGGENVSIPTLTRPWIVPGEIIIRETTTNAYIYKANLKVMLEQDYLKGSQEYGFDDPRFRTLNEYSTQLIREKIIPKLIREVNTSRRYASLRQVYYSLILAQWFKARFAGQESPYASVIDRKDLSCLTSGVPWSTKTYFKAYRKFFKDGEYDIRRSVVTASGQAVRSYFSGGMSFFDGGFKMPAPSVPGRFTSFRQGDTEVTMMRGDDARSLTGTDNLQVNVSGIGATASSGAENADIRAGRDGGVDRQELAGGIQQIFDKMRSSREVVAGKKVIMLAELSVLLQELKKIYLYSHEHGETALMGGRKAHIKNIIRGGGQRIVPYLLEVLKAEEEGGDDYISDLLKTPEFIQPIIENISVFRKGVSRGRLIKVLRELLFSVRVQYLSTVIKGSPDLRKPLLDAVLEALGGPGGPVGGKETPEKSLTGWETWQLLRLTVTEEKIPAVIALGVNNPETADAVIRALSGRRDDAFVNLLLLHAARLELDKVSSEELLRLVAALLEAGEKARQRLAELRPETVQGITNKMAGWMVLPENSNRFLDGIFADWLVFTADRKEITVHGKGEWVRMYFTGRQNAADLIVRAEDYIESHPDASYEELMGVLGDSLAGANTVVRARFQAGMLKFLRNRQQVLRLKAAAEKVGIRNGAVLTRDDLEADQGRGYFIRTRIGLIPEFIQLFFFPDTLYITIDPESYIKIRLKVGTDENVSRAQRKKYENEGGVYGFRLKGDLIESASDIVILEKAYAPSVHPDPVIRRHEQSHRFFHGYADDELRGRLLSQEQRIPAVVKAINGQTGVERVKAIRALVTIMMNVFLFSYQDEMTSMIVDGRWVRGEDISGWFEEYKEEYYLERLRNMISEIKDKRIRERIEQRTFAGLWKLFEESKPIVDDIIRKKAKSLLAQGELSSRRALERAQKWAKAFFYTMPLTNYKWFWYLLKGLPAELQSPSVMRDGGVGSGVQAPGLGALNMIYEGSSGREYTAQALARMVTEKESKAWRDGGGGAIDKAGTGVFDGRYSVESILMDYRTRMRQAASAWEAQKKAAEAANDRAFMERADEEARKASDKLQEAERRVEELRSLMKGDTVGDFVQALKETGGVRSGRTPVQAFALGIIGAVKDRTYIKGFDPEKVLFIPPDSWCMDLFDFSDFRAMIEELGTGAGRENLVLVREGIVDPLELIQIIIHEWCHPTFSKGKRAVHENKREEAAFFRILEEAVVSRMEIETMMDIYADNPLLMKMAADRLSDAERKEIGSIGADPSEYIVKTTSGYLKERIMLDALFASPETGGSNRRSVMKFLLLGDSADLRQFFGPAWQEVTAMTSAAANSSNALGLQRTVVYVLTSALKDPARMAEMLAAGNSLVKTVAAARVNPEDYLPRFARVRNFNYTSGEFTAFCRLSWYNTAARLFDTVIEREKPVSPGRFYRELEEEINTNLARISLDGGSDDTGPALSDPGAAKNKGGIDFRALPVVIQSMRPIAAALSAAEIGRLGGIDLDAEWGNIRRLVNGGIIPSHDRIRDYVLACHLKQRLGKDEEMIISCIASIFRIEEERAEDADTVLRDLLVWLESGVTRAANTPVI